MMSNLLFIVLIGLACVCGVVAAHYYDKWVEAKRKIKKKLRRIRNPMTP